MRPARAAARVGGNVAREAMISVRTADRLGGNVAREAVIPVRIAEPGAFVRVRSFACVAATIAILAGCGGATVRREPARVAFELQPPTARVYTDDRFVGAARVLARRTVEFPPGVRHFTITADDHFPHDLELDLPSGTSTVRVRLRPIPP